MLIDDVIVTIKAGKGGNGSAAFRREKFVPKGGPYGGDGGDGGDVYIEAVDDIMGLRQFSHTKSATAEDGGAGGTAKMHGLNGKDLTILLPRGTIVTDIDTQETWELKKRGERLLVAKGGVGGRGNVWFATSTNQTPKYAELGTRGQMRHVRIELRLIADVGFIGLPNAGKSSLLNELTNAAVKVANYPFTTLEPNLGAMAGGVILADIPGLIEGASKGKGLGFKFLRHIARTGVLAHCISVENEDMMKTYQTVRHELEAYSDELSTKKEIILITKSDLVDPSVLKEKMSALKSLHKEMISVSIHDLDSINIVQKDIKKFIQS